MKKIFKALTVAVLITSIFSGAVVKADAATERCWYVRRNGNLQPPPPNGYSEISDLGAYYLDRDLSDDSSEKRLYLTFDAGYENGNVEKILDTLREEKVPAAFFLLDNIILKNTDLVKRMVNEGHFVCNHTKRHKNLSGASADEIKKDLEALEQIYTECIGGEMKKYFRFPEGKYSKDAVSAVNALGYKTVFWSFAYDDWDNGRQPDRDAAIKKILSNTHNGAVILLHPTSATNAAILGEVIREWKAMGYTFGTLDDLCK